MLMGSLVLSWLAAVAAPERPIVLIRPEGRVNGAVMAYVADATNAHAMIVPRSDQLQAVRRMQRESLRACVDEACNVELGREVAASHLLVVSLRGDGGAEVVLRLIDVARAARVWTASGCRDDIPATVDALWTGRKTEGCTKRGPMPVSPSVTSSGSDHDPPNLRTLDDESTTYYMVRYGQPHVPDRLQEDMVAMKDLAVLLVGREPTQGELTETMILCYRTANDYKISIAAVVGSAKHRLLASQKH